MSSIKDSFGDNINAIQFVESDTHMHVAEAFW